MNEELYTRLSELPSERLLVILAFFMGQYTREAQAVLRHLGTERGLTDDDVHRFRQLALLPKAASYHCQNCQELLDLDEHDLRNGLLTCPVCDRLQLINYRLIPGCAQNLDFSEDDERSLSSLLGEWEDDSERPAPVGIGGWLNLLAAVLAVGLLYNLMMLPRAVDAGAMWATAANLIDILMFGGLLFLMFRRAQVFPRLCSFWLAYLAVALVLQGTASALWPEDYLRGLLGVTIAALWIPYLIRSRRVAATFVRPLRTRQVR